MKKTFDPLAMPPMESVEFLEFADDEKQILKKAPSLGMLEDLIPRPAFRYVQARLKLRAKEHLNAFLGGVAIPQGLEHASAREAYYSGLVNGLRWALDLKRQLWQDAVRETGSDEEPQEPLVEREPDPFDLLGEPVAGEKS